MNNLLMLLPFLMGKNGGNMNEMMNLFSMMNGKNGAENNPFGNNPMLSMMMNMMGKNNQKQEEKDIFHAIKNLSGEEVTRALKILLNSKN